jgi:hypothetical protein
VLVQVRESFERRCLREGAISDDCFHRYQRNAGVLDNDDFETVRKCRPLNALLELGALGRDSRAGGGQDQQRETSCTV